MHQHVVCASEPIDSFFHVGRVLSCQDFCHLLLLFPVLLILADKF